MPCEAISPMEKERESSNGEPPFQKLRSVMIAMAWSSGPDPGFGAGVVTRGQLDGSISAYADFISPQFCSAQNPEAHDIY